VLREIFERDSSDAKEGCNTRQGFLSCFDGAVGEGGLEGSISRLEVDEFALATKRTRFFFDEGR
jgi:hypothetical protein